MKRNLTIEVECGEATCAARPDSICRWFRWAAQPKCELFNAHLYSKGGGMRRFQECLDSEQEKYPW